VSIPVVVVLALALATTHTSSSSSQSQATAVVPVSPVPTDSSTVEPCAQVQANLPVALNGASPRIVHALQAVAWGDPAIVLRCGVPRPTALVPNSSAQTALINSVNWLVEAGKRDIVYTVIDRSVYIEVTLPVGTDPNAAVPVIANAVAKALPTPSCYVETPLPERPDLPMCTRR
jgi:hypothetical protein